MLRETVAVDPSESLLQHGGGLSTKTASGGALSVTPARWVEWPALSLDACGTRRRYFSQKGLNSAAEEDVTIADGFIRCWDGWWRVVDHRVDDHGFAWWVTVPAEGVGGRDDGS